MEFLMCLVKPLHPNWWARRWFLALWELWELFGLQLSGNCSFLEVVHRHTILVLRSFTLYLHWLLLSRRLKGNPAQISGAPSLGSSFLSGLLPCKSAFFFEATLSFSETARFRIPSLYCYLQTASKQNTRAIKGFTLFVSLSQGP